MGRNVIAIDEVTADKGLPHVHVHVHDHGHWNDLHDPPKDVANPLMANM